MLLVCGASIIERAKTVPQRATFHARGRMPVQFPDLVSRLVGG